MVIVQSGGGDITLALTKVPQNLQLTAFGGNITLILPPTGTKYDIITRDSTGGNVNIPSSLIAANSPHKITVDSSGGDITISHS